MKKTFFLGCIILLAAIGIVSYKDKREGNTYLSVYFEKLNKFRKEEKLLLEAINEHDIHEADGLAGIMARINEARNSLKGIDFWLRYLEPIAYKKINGPLPVEWETEVFEKFEKPYKREGAGLTLAALYAEEETAEKDSLSRLIQSSVTAAECFVADSITGNLNSYHHFYLCNRLFLLNLAAIYTTGFECPDTARIIPELRVMLKGVKEIYQAFNESFPATPIYKEYLTLYTQAILFADRQPANFSGFDNFLFIKNFINPLFRLNQQMIAAYNVKSKSFVDYSLNRKNISIFDKQLYNGQNAKGIYRRVEDKNVLAEIEKLGRLLFYDPILSGNNKRSCVSCHKSTEYFTDTATLSSLQFNGKDYLPRNSPSLINVVYNHLVMLDGQHISLQNQTKAVITNPNELNNTEKELVQKVLSCPDYKKAFEKLLAYTPQETEITVDHILSAITFYYSKFSNYYSPFDFAINGSRTLSGPARKGFNIFMSKAQCATCHFVPQFNGVKPPYVGSEFEVLGVPADTTFKKLSLDKGRYNINPAYETMNAFRTGSLRNIEHTAPYMHNGVFRTLEEVIDFYDAGGGAGKGLTVPNQTLSSDSLRLSKTEKYNLLQFLKSLDEEIPFETPPAKLPLSNDISLNKRKTGGTY